MILRMIGQIVLSGGRTISYEYDAEERITKVVDSVDGTTVYTYNANGIRTSKTVNGVKHTYTLDGTNIVKEE